MNTPSSFIFKILNMKREGQYSCSFPSFGKTISNIGFFSCLFKPAGSETILSTAKERQEGTSRMARFIKVQNMLTEVKHVTAGGKKEEIVYNKSLIC